MNAEDLEKLKNNSLCPDLDENQLIKGIKLLSQNFTMNRESIGQYVSDAELVSAYNCFYLPTNMPKFDFLWERLPASVQEDLGRCLFFDWGTGPGTYLLAYLFHYPKGEVCGVDTSLLMRKQAEKNLMAFFPDSIFQVTHFYDGSRAGDKKIYLNFGNSLNEMGPHAASTIIDRCGPEYISFIEPGTPKSFAEVLKMKGKLEEQGYTCLYPCLPGGNGSCPLRESEDWCHQTVVSKYPQKLERLMQKVQLDRSRMPALIHFYQKSQGEGPGAGEGEARILRLLNDTKHSLIYQVCMIGEQKWVTKTLHIPKKDIPKSQLKSLKKMPVGLTLRFKDMVALKNGEYRAKWGEII